MKVFSIKRKVYLIILFTCMVSLITLSTIALLLGRQTLKKEAAEKVDYALTSISSTFIKNITEAQNVIAVLKNTVDLRLQTTPLTSSEAAERFIVGLNETVQIQAQNHTQSYTAYIYLNPFLWNQSFDVYYADDTGTGKPVVQSRIPVSYYKSGEDDPDKAWWFGPLKTQKTYWTKPYDWTLDNGKTTRFISITEPFYVDDTFYGVVGTDLNFDYLIDALKSFKVYDSGFAFLLDGDGELIYSPYSLTENIKNDYLIYTRKINENWTIGISVPEFEIYGQLKDYTLKLMVAIGTLLLFLSFISYLFSKSITSPINALVGAIQESKSRPLYMQIDSKLLNRRDELGTLTKVLLDYDNQLFNMHTELRLIDEALEHSDNGLFITDRHLKLIYVNKTFKNITQYMPELNKSTLVEAGINVTGDMINQLNLMSSVQTETLQKRNNGSVYPLHLYLTKFENPKIYYMGIIKDLTLQKVKEKQLHEVRYYDALTQLPNREHFIELSKRKLLSEVNEPLYCIIVNIDNFRLLNNLYGHKVCDALLLEISKRMSKELPSQSVYGRTDGDEFSILMSAEDAERSTLFVNQLKKHITEEYHLMDEKLFITFSAGVSKFPNDDTHIQGLMKKANIALTQAKVYGKNQLVFYENKEDTSMTSNYDLYKNLRHALDRNELFLEYQPQVNALTGKVYGFEALMRWHSNGKLIPPSDFIPIAEESRWIIPIGQFALEKCFALVNQLEKRGHPVQVSLNLSVEQLKFDIIIQQISALIQMYPVATQRITFEVTESVLVTSESEAIEVIHQLRHLGFKIALDDFGMGYSSLGYLKDIPFDCIKLDRVFIKDYPNADNGNIAALIIKLAHELKVDLIAEGVETEAQKNYMLSKGAEKIQGYYYSKPLKEEALFQYLDSHQ